MNWTWEGNNDSTQIMILRTSITGNIGSAAARTLLARGVKFRALVRNTAEAAA